uniref:Uncharacterized protein n=1 Tax=Rhizophora mucronata TaxID=61149 RepID=A0A2P2IMI4_RHIMU
MKLFQHCRGNFSTAQLLKKLEGVRRTIRFPSNKNSIKKSQK